MLLQGPEQTDDSGYDTEDREEEKQPWVSPKPTVEEGPEKEADGDR